MTKFTKLSLITALAIAGTTASAQPLAEAIKNVDVSGTVAYRYNDYEEKNINDDSESINQYKIAVSLSSKVNEDITANTRFIVGEKGAAPISLRNHATNTSPANGDSNPNVTVSEVNFAYSGIANTTVIVGKQGLATPFTLHRDAMGNEQTGTGALVQTTFGPLTLAGAYFNQTNLNVDVGELSTELKDPKYLPPLSVPLLDGSENVLTAGAILNIAGVSLDAWYVDLQDVFDAYTIGLAASYDIDSINLSPYARYTALDLENSNLDNVLWKVGLRAQIGIFGAHLGYGETDKEGGVSSLDYSAETGYDEHWRVTLSGQTDSDVIYASVNAQVLPKLNISLNYSDLDNDSEKTKEKEIYTQVKYDMSKNFYTFVRFGQYEVEQTGADIDSSIGRVHVQYSF